MSQRIQRIEKGDLRDGLRVVVWDLETVTLDASFGRVLCGTVKEIGKKPDTYRIDKTKTYKKEPWNDRELVVAIRDRLNQAHVAVAYNGIRFDVPYLNSRLLHHGFEPIAAGVQHVDPVFIARNRMRLGSNTLARLLDFMGCKEQKLHLGPEVWQRAAAGSRKDMDLLVKRNVSDCVALEQLFNKLISMVPLKFSLVR